MSFGDPPGPIGTTGKDVKTEDGTLARTKAMGPGPLGLSAKGGDEKPTPDALRAQVVAFARQKIGDRVGSGECFDLADRALRDAGANSAADFGQVTPNGNYRWGTSINLSQLRPGDIIQFRNYRYVRRITEADGSWAEDEQERPHHTAIVDSIDGGGCRDSVGAERTRGIRGDSMSALFFQFTNEQWRHTNKHNSAWEVLVLSATASLILK